MSQQLMLQLLDATWQTLFMVFASCALAVIIGGPLGILLLLTRERHLLACPPLNKVLGVIINILRSIPFIILMIAIIPFTRFIVGTSIGVTAAIVPLTVAAAPFMARLVESALEQVPKGLIETGQAMGATPWQIIYKILLPESFKTIIRGITLALITLVGYSAMAGAIGGGGLGDLAISYGYQRFDLRIMCFTVVILIVLVQLLQMGGDCIAKRKRRSS